MTLGRTVTDVGDVIDLLVAVGDAETIEVGVGIVPQKVDEDAVACLSGSEGILTYGRAAAFVLLDIDRTETTAVGMVLLELVEVEAGIGRTEDLGDLQAEQFAVAELRGVVADEDAGFCPFAHDDEDALTRHEVLDGTEEGDELDGTFDDDTIGHIEHETVLAEQGIERSFAQRKMGRDVGALGTNIVGRLVVHGKTVVVTRSDVGITEGKLAE